MKVSTLLLSASIVVASLAPVGPAAAQVDGAPVNVMSAARVQQIAQVERDPLTVATALVARWEPEGRASGRWNATTASDLLGALMKVSPENLLLASEASSYKEVLQIIATGGPGAMPKPDAVAVTSLAARLGDANLDMVFTPVTPCRIADTRVAGGAIAGNTSRLFDLDGTNLAAQGGSNTGCGVPFGVAYSAALTITVVYPQAGGYLTAFGLSALPLAASMTYLPGALVSTTTIVPDVPGGGTDFTVYSWATTDVVIDVVGYYAAPVATALDCTIATSAVTSIPVNVWTAVDVACPTGRVATGGGTIASEGTLGWPGMWTTSLPATVSVWRTWADNQSGGARSLQTYAQCCRVPGR